MHRAFFLVLLSGFAAAACEAAEVKPPADQVDGGRDGDGSIPVDAANADAGVDDADARVDDAGADGGATPDGDAATPCMCAAGQGCLILTVDRLPSDATMPWIVWPSEADGRGTLVASVYSDPLVVLATRTVPNADFQAASARYSVDLGCLAQGTVTSAVFLDDNESRDPGAIFSSDYRDTCGRPGPGPIAIESQKTTAVTFTLKQTCD